MNHTFAIRLGCLCILIAGAWVAYTQTPPPAPLAATKIKDDLYVVAPSRPGSGGGGNVAVYLTDEGVILVDDMFDRNYDEIMGLVKSLTSKPVRYVLNSHQHDDHAGGNAKMMASAEVIAHRNVRANMVLLKQPGQPRVTFSDEMQVFLGGKEVRTKHLGRGHTGGDAVIQFPAARTIHTGDLFLTNPTLPFIDYANGGSAVEWTRTLDEILKLDFDIAIPGHGPMSDKTGIRKWRDDFEKMRNRISSLVHQGKSKEEVSKVLVSEFRWSANGLSIQQVDAFIAELKR